MLTAKNEKCYECVLKNTAKKRKKRRRFQWKLYGLETKSGCILLSNDEGVPINRKAIKQKADVSFAAFATYLYSDWLKDVQGFGKICQYD